MRHLSTIAGLLLGLGFVTFGLMFLLNLMPPQPAPPEGSLMALFFGAFAPSGYLHFVKVFEVYWTFVHGITFASYRNLI